MRDAFVRALITLAKSNNNIELITGDLGFGVLKPYFEAIPNQFTNAGIAEQNMTGLAAGMAKEGKIVFTYSIANFPTLRCIEQIRNDCAYHKLDVKIVCVGGGFAYGSLGMSHHATEDIACMRALPNVTVIAPGDLVEAEEAVKAIINHSGTVYLRLGRGGEKKIHNTISDFKIGKALTIQKSDNPKLAVFSTGAILDETTEACNLAIENGIALEQYSFHTVKPIDAELILLCADKFENIITVEEHNIIGGFGSAVAEVLASSSSNCKLTRIGLQDEYTSLVGSQEYLREHHGLTCKGIVNQMLNIVKK